MHSSQPPRLGNGIDTRHGWGILRAVARRFPDPALLAGNAAHTGRLDVYLTDMLRPYHLELEPGVPTRGQSYGEMAEAVISATVGPDEPVDLLVLVHAVPDIAPGRATATYLSYVCPGNPMAFAICDQGTAGAFTGLRLARDYAAGGSRRALLVIVEQSELPYDAGIPVTVPTVHAAVALLFGDAPAAARLGTVRNRPGVLPDDARAALAGEVAARCAGRPGVTLIVGAPLAAAAAGLSDVDRVRIAPAGQPYTGVWWALAQEITDRTAGLVVLADHDAELGYLSTAAIDIAAPAKVTVTLDAAGGHPPRQPDPESFETVR